MKRLLPICSLFLCLSAYTQSFPVKNINDDYVIINLKGSEAYKNNIKEVIRDRNGLYWFQNLSTVSSFDGRNWRSYTFTDANGRDVPVRINEIEVTDDKSIWLATAEGMYGLDRRSEKFIPVKKMYPKLEDMPLITNCIYKGKNDFLFVSFVKEGFYIFNWNNGSVKHVIIDSIDQIFVPTDNSELDVTVDKAGNYWGLTREKKGIWCYDPITGQIKRSWKGELFAAASKRLQGRNITGIAYSRNDNAFWLSYASEGILEKLYIATGKSSYYSFTDELSIRADTNSKKRHKIMSVIIDRDGNEWILVDAKYLVKLNPDLTKVEYLNNDPELLPLGKMDWLLPETRMQSTEKLNDENLIWINGDKGLSVVKKRNPFVKQIPFEKESINGIKSNDYINYPSAFKNIIPINGCNDDYILLQQNPGRPKILRFDRQLHITDVLFNDKWKQYPAYFNPITDNYEFYIALLRPTPEKEPLDFRNVVAKDFRVDLRTMEPVENDLTFSQRVWHYGSADASNIYWLFSNGYLYSFDPGKNLLDSIFVCDISTKEAYPNSRIKGYDFPTVLHKNSSTFWISFIANKELYKIDLKKRVTIKVIRSCLDQKDCLSGSIVQLYDFDSSRIYGKLSNSGVLINPLNDSITIYSDLFKNKLPVEDYVGTAFYKDWLCNVSTTEINFQNSKTGLQKRLSLNKDFKWTLSAISFSPLINRNGEMIVMSSSQKGFIVLNIDSILYPEPPGVVRFSNIQLDEKKLPLDSIVDAGYLKLKYNGYKNIDFRFSDYSVVEQDKIKYEYSLYSGGDTSWKSITGEPELSFTKISPGEYKLLIRAANGFGDYSAKVTSFNISIKPPFTQTVWFVILVILGAAAILYGIYTYRLQQIKKLQLIRNNIASDLHDDIGSTLNSISIYSEVAKQQAGKDVPALELIGVNSRKIIENMSDIVWTINPENDSFEKVIIRMRSFAYNILKAKKIEYTFDAGEKLNSISLTMQERKNFYLVFKEAVTNLVKYSEATKVAISLQEVNKIIILRIRDNGIGITTSPEAQGNGLLNMKRRAEEIKASLQIETERQQGTMIEMKLKL